MDAIREWAIALCTSAVLCAAAGMIAPEEKNSRGMKIILASVMLCAVVLPLTKLTECNADFVRSAEEYLPDSRLCTAVEQ